MPDSSIYHPIPPARRDAVEHAVRQTFPGQELESLAPLAGGQSGTPIFKLFVAGRPSVLRVILVNTPLSDPKRQFTCMELAAREGIAPPVYHADASTGISITGFIESRSIRQAMQGSPEPVTQLGELLRRLHAGPAFPVFMDALQMIEGGLGTLATVKFPLPERVQLCLAHFAKVRDVLRPHWLAVPCHNDLNPSNVLFDGGRPWLIDWEGGSQGDPFFDLATVLHWFALTPELEAAFLRAYFGAPPDARQGAKLELMRHVVSCFYGTVFLLLRVQQGLTSPPASPQPERVPTLLETLRALGAGTLKMQEPDVRYQLSLVFFEDALQRALRPEFARALESLGS